MKFSFKSILAGAAMASAFALPSLAEDFPTHPITLVYPYGAGSTTDTAFRALEKAIQEKLGWIIVHENRPGSGGRIGFDYVVQQPADGYTIGMGSSAGLIWLPSMQPELAIEPGKDYTPIIEVWTSPSILVAGKSSPVHTIEELLAYAKEHPGELTVASAGIGTVGHLGTALLKSQGGVDMTHVPYNGGAAAVQGVLAGEVDMVFTDASSKPYVDDGEMWPLAVAGKDEWNVFPGVKTLDSVGLPGASLLSLVTVMGPPGMPEDVVQKLHDAFKVALDTPEVRELIEGRGAGIIQGGSSEEVKARLQEQLGIFGPLIKEAGIRMQ